ncbi:MAG: hydantoinase/carbamoylase family amidase [Lachnospiraceae bacterium]|jgi:N-carbamoyl-L-amino-acid hydrolase|nr:hydantoinase/carbamoylase family amidase [Lachnospiraceae bacterium]
MNDMLHSIEDISYAEYLFDKFYNVGDTGTGGVTRLGYTPAEDEMHGIFAALGAEEGYVTETDEVGNTYLSNLPADDSYYLIGSHLDSVIEGGRYDGVAGVIAGLMILHWLKPSGLHIPVKVVALRCEESSNFGRSTIGSGLITNEIYKHDVGEAIGKDGRTLSEIFAERGYSLQPKRIRGVRQYLELHIEQGKVLEEYGDRIGIVTTVAGPRRFNLHIIGQAEHSGATPMDMRKDALCAAAEIILEIEAIGKEESIYSSVATVGVVQNTPNALNVIPGEVTLGVDMRGIKSDSLDRMETRMKNASKRICQKRGLTFFKEQLSSIPPIDMNQDMQEKLCRVAKDLKIQFRQMSSGAGHDAMSFAAICDAGLVFIPCDKGVSHSKHEFATIESICDGSRVIYEYLKSEYARQQNPSGK